MVYGLAGVLAIALLVAAFTDLRRRQIDNWLNAGIAALAPVYWWACGLHLWPDVVLQLGVAVAAFVVLAGLFALRMMGGVTSSCSPRWRCGCGRCCLPSCC
ncbi:prepilin peptidase [Novosphingobium pokkalii]|jgi:prepilin peptidase CpaA|uniref:prepilin peptidase n=1 Tax=Novosphingobium pokkalii TaxID=1770194 RepID=UPI00364380ED